MENVIYTLKNKKASKYLPETFEKPALMENRLRTQDGILIGYTENGVDTDSHSCFAEIMADPEIEKVHSNTTIYNQDSDTLTKRTYHFVPYCNYNHPYYKDAVKQSLPESEDYEYTVVFTYVDDSCGSGDEACFVHLPLTSNCISDIDDLVTNIGRYEYADIKKGVLQDFWEVEYEELELDDDEDDDEKEERDILDSGVPFFNECGEKFLSREFNIQNLVAFKIVDIRKLESKETTED